MATHSSILGWKIPWTEEPRGLQWGHTNIYLCIYLVFSFLACWCISVWPIVFSDILGILTLSNVDLLHWFSIYIPLPFFQAFFLFLPASFFPLFPCPHLSFPLFLQIFLPLLNTDYKEITSVTMHHNIKIQKAFFTTVKMPTLSLGK